MSNLIELKPRINKANHQINFQLKKSDLSKSLKAKIGKGKLKCIKLEEKDFEFDSW
jgi:hypothetical protein